MCVLKLPPLPLMVSFFPDARFSLSSDKSLSEPFFLRSRRFLWFGLALCAGLDRMLFPLRDADDRAEDSVLSPVTDSAMVDEEVAQLGATVTALPHRVPGNVPNARRRYRQPQSGRQQNRAWTPQCPAEVTFSKITLEGTIGVGAHGQQHKGSVMAHVRLRRSSCAGSLPHQRNALDPQSISWSLRRAQL